MTHDVLTKLSSALAGEHDGAHPAPDATRARIMARLAAEQQKKKRRWILWTPLFALGIGSTALAASGGSLVSALASLPEWFTSHAPSQESSGASTTVAPARPRSEPRPDSEPKEPQTLREEIPKALGAAPAAPAPSDAPRSEPREIPPSRPQPKATAALDRAHETRSQNAPVLPAPQGPQGAGAAETPRPAESLGLDVYRKAHDAQFRSRDCRAALEGYAAYLRQYPSGALRLEASYNTALCELELGLVDRARRSLAPFARGTYGSYRQAEARALLEALGAPSSE